VKSSARSLTTLQVFVASARLLSFSKAAEAVHLTQGAVSKQIKALELDLGVELFTRHAKGLELTDAGKAYLEQIAPALDRLTLAASRLTDYSRNINQLAIGVPPAIAEWAVPRLVDFMAQHPDISVSIRPRQRAQLRPVGATVSDALDAEICFGEGPWPNRHARYLLGRDVSLVASPVLVTRLGIRYLTDLPVVKPPLLKNVHVPTVWQSWAEAVGLKKDALALKDATEYEQYAVLLPAVIVGMGLAVVPRFLIESHLRSGALIAPFGEVVRAHPGYHLVVPRSLRRHRPLELLTEHLSLEARRTTSAHPKTSPFRAGIPQSKK
jgi:LysR family transcriptional regulator, glycine cleavage system transcriptional activator